jgi:hypothetical protein
MLRLPRPGRHLWVVVAKSAMLAVTSAVFGGCTLDDAIDRMATVQLASDPLAQPAAVRAQMAFPPLASGREQSGPAPACRPPVVLCEATIKALEQGAFLDFRASHDDEAATIRLLSPFDISRIDPLDRARCPAKLCAAHVALESLLADLLREGYHRQSVSLYAGSAVLTLRTERIGRDANVLKGACRFNLDPKCVGSDSWLQDDKRTGGPCGFAQTRVFVAAAVAPEFVPASSFVPAGSGPAAGVERLRLAALDAAGVRVYELLYVHKVCRNEMVLVRSG